MAAEARARQFRVTQLYYITHADNVASMFVHGILSHNQITSKGIDYVPIYDKEIVESRRKRLTPDGKSLWDYANLFFQPRNPMLYRVVYERGSAADLAVLAVDRSVIRSPRAFVTTGIAASHLSHILPSARFEEAFAKFREAIGLEYWKEADGSKRRIMAECLVPDAVSPEKIKSVFVSDLAAVRRLKTKLSGFAPTTTQIVPEPHMFFQPYRQINLTGNLSLIDGDMFFSHMHTLTVSVNTVGVMGKGLASRAKYQFPDVYVKYQDVCRSRALRMGKPFLYKRESSFDYELADEPGTMKAANTETWFLLFATKQHWRDQASIEGIEKGLQWLQENYRSEGVKSLAIPALGCGLGRLEWADVGPILCRYLAALDIPVQVYLPAERKVPDKELTKGFLLRGVLA